MSRWVKAAELIDFVGLHPDQPSVAVEVWNDWVYCEKHGSSFDCRSGEVRGLPATDDVQAFSVEQRGEEIWVELPDFA